MYGTFALFEHRPSPSSAALTRERHHQATSNNAIRTTVRTTRKAAATSYLRRLDSSPQNAKRIALSSSAPLCPASSIRAARSRRCSFDSPQKSFGSLDGIGCVPPGIRIRIRIRGGAIIRKHCQTTSVSYAPLFNTLHSLNSDLKKVFVRSLAQNDMTTLGLN